MSESRPTQKPLSQPLKIIRQGNFPKNWRQNVFKQQVAKNIYRGSNYNTSQVALYNNHHFLIWARHWPAITPISRKFSVIFSPSKNGVIDDQKLNFCLENSQLIAGHHPSLAIRTGNFGNFEIFRTSQCEYLPITQLLGREWPAIPPITRKITKKRAKNIIHYTAYKVPLTGAYKVLGSKMGIIGCSNFLLKPLQSVSVPFSYKNSVLVTRFLSMWIFLQ